MSAQWLLPIRCESRISLSEIRLTHIGQFGLPRKARMGIPAHLHTGIDIMRPNENYVNQPIFPASNGVVISIRDEGPFSQIIIEHTVKSFGKLWSVYEHVAGIRCSLGQKVEPSDTIARFFNRRELDKHGWQFDHLHFEILRVSPIRVSPKSNLPDYHFATYALTCYTKELLEKRMYNPILFFQNSKDVNNP